MFIYLKNSILLSVIFVFIFNGKSECAISRNLITADNELVFDILPIDSIFQITNNGMTRFYANLNGHKFKITTSPEETRNGINTYLIPKNGVVVFNIAKYLYDWGDPQQNRLTLIPQGSFDATAEILLADFNLEGRTDYFLELQEYPVSLLVYPVWPNPFNNTVTIKTEIPQDYWKGTNVNVSVYDAIGRKIKKVVSKKLYSGTFLFNWNGKNESDRDVASGVYFVIVSTGQKVFRQRVVLLR